MSEQNCVWLVVFHTGKACTILLENFQKFTPEVLVEWKVYPLQSGPPAGPPFGPHFDPLLGPYI